MARMKFCISKSYGKSATENIPESYKNPLYRIFRLSCFFLMISMLLSCGDSATTTATSGENGTIEFQLKVEENNTEIQATIPPQQEIVSKSDFTQPEDICINNGISTIKAYVYESSGTLLKEGLWNCSAHSGQLNDITAGSGYILRTEGYVDGAVKYKGELSGISVTANTTTNAGTVIMTTTPPPSPPTPTHVPTMDIVSVPSSVAKGGSYSITISYQDSAGDILNVCYSEYVGGQPLYQGRCIAAGAWGIAGTSGSGTYSFTTDGGGGYGVHNLEIWVVDSAGNQSIHRFYNLIWTCPVGQQLVGNTCQPLPSPSNQLWNIESSTGGKITATHSGLYLSVDNTGNNVSQLSSSHNWRFVPSGSYIQIISNTNDKCMDVVNASLNDQANVQVFTCGQGDHQLWSLKKLADGYTQIINKHSNKCLDVTSASTASGANVQQYSCR